MKPLSSRLADSPSQFIGQRFRAPVPLRPKDRQSFSLRVLPRQGAIGPSEDRTPDQFFDQPVSAAVLHVAAPAALRSQQ